MEEMQQMMERRQKNLSDGSVRRGPSIAMPGSILDQARLHEWTHTVDILIEDADKQIAQAMDQSDALVKDMALLSVDDDVRSLLVCVGVLLTHSGLIWRRSRATAC